MRSQDWLKDEPKPKVSKVPKSFKRLVVDLPEMGCHNCRNWRRPRDPDKDEFGTCGVAVTLTRRIPMGPEKGTCLELKRAIAAGIYDYEMMRTLPYFASCRLYVSGDVQDAEPSGDREHPIQGSLFDRVAERRET